MDTRLKNIESTEKAKRAMLEARKNAPKPMTDAEHDFAAARCAPLLVGRGYFAHVD